MPKTQPTKTEKKPAAPKITLEELSKQVSDLTKRVATLEANATPVTVDCPTAEEIAALSHEERLELAKKLRLDTEGMNKKGVLALMTTVATVVEGGEVEGDDVNTALKAAGIAVTKKEDKNLAALQDYLGVSESGESGDESDESGDDDSSNDEDDSDSSGDDDEDGDSSDDGEDDSDSSGGDDEDSDSSDDDDDSDSSGDDDEDSDSSDDDDEGEASSDDDDEDSDSSGDDDEDSDSSGDDDDEEGEASDDEDEDSSSDIDPTAVAKEALKSKKEAWEKRHALYLKKGGKQKKLLAFVADNVNNDGEIAAWKSAYEKGDEGYCCGLPLKEGAKGLGICAVTGTKFKVKNGAFVVVP